MSMKPSALRAMPSLPLVVWVRPVKRIFSLILVAVAVVMLIAVSYGLSRLVLRVEAETLSPK